ncbi:MAG: 2-C-methyl-D-erythritol 4-phosphate cytidylyltransferase [Desulfobacterales bacterium]|jgi:2-C-methyl-D-erythritol 4-phosphate cytidylyltransferase|nr:2-C-methyl-D-erythritol 4-phosphate cytidylyltransferase [Desulfobacterales bacterium]
MASAIVAAGGKGIRMSSDVRKQYLNIGGMPILSRTILAVDRCPAVEKIYLVVPGHDLEFCERFVLAPIHCRSQIRLVPGGRTRQESVYNGLSAADNKTGVVLIHDGVRPFVTKDLIGRCLQEAEIGGACILGIPLKDTLKSCDGQGNITGTIERGALWQAQTPQAFQFHLIYKAHEHALSNGIQATDDASLLESMGQPVKVITGSTHNIKITTPEDLVLARALLSLPEYQII